MMISNHYPMITDQRMTWLIVGLVVVGGAALRAFPGAHSKWATESDKIAWTLPLIGSALAAALIITEPATASGLSGRCQRCGCA